MNYKQSCTDPDCNHTACLHVQVDDNGEAASATEAEAVASRRNFLKGGVLAAGASATGAGLIGAAYAADAPGASKMKKHYFIPANDKTVH